MVFPLLKHLISLGVIKRIMQTLRYPSEVGQELPRAEVLSIAVSERARGRGVGKQLMAAAKEEFMRRGIRSVKVAVGADNIAACRFYENCGFVLVQTREHHGLPMNIYVMGLSKTTAVQDNSGIAAQLVV